MQFTTDLMPDLVESIAKVIAENAEQIAILDQILGDGDHLTNLQRGIAAVRRDCADYPQLGWSQVWQQIGMTLLSTMGGASGSLLATLFISLSKATSEQTTLDRQSFAAAYMQAVAAVKKRGKSGAGEKTLLDVLIPVATLAQQNNPTEPLPVWLEKIKVGAINGMESTRDMVATKGRASYLQANSLGHIDAGAKTCQLIICVISEELQARCIA